MDFVKNLAASAGANADAAPAAAADAKSSSSAKKPAGFMDKLNNMAGGGEQGERNEDGLDKAIDFVQEKLLGQGDQSNESAAEQAKDEAISDLIRDKYKAATGNDFPIPDKKRKPGFF